MERNEEEARDKIVKVMEGLQPRQRREVVRKLIQEHDALRVKIGADKRTLTMFQGVQTWLARPITLDRNSTTRFHKLCDACKDGELHCVADKGEPGEKEGGSFAEPDGALGAYFGAHVFLVKHDWAKAFDGAVGVSDEWKLPYDLCVFEFVISGHPVIVIAMSKEVAKDDPSQRACAFIEINNEWATLGNLQPTCPHLVFAWNQIRAICIALDAEVAVSSVERAPLRLNENRVRKGKSPIRDYHVVDLSHRRRVIGPGTETGTRKRLHFRRGHWRHFEQHKTWIKWMLVGDPDLGFVAKDYSL